MKAWPMFCKHCGQSISREDQFCVRCGQLTPQQHFESDAFHADPPQPETPPVAESRLNASLAPRILDLDLDPERPSAAPQGVPVVVRAEHAADGIAPAGEALNPGYVRTRKSSLPVIELLVAALLVVGAIAAIWILRATLPNRARTQSKNIVVTIKPSAATARVGKEVAFAAAVSGDANNEVDWSLQEGAEGGRLATRGAKAEAGKVWSLVTYTAPRKAGTYHLLATSKANAQSFAVASITVVRK
jgi:hypothetical protein